MTDQEKTIGEVGEAGEVGDLGANHPAGVPKTAAAPAAAAPAQSAGEKITKLSPHVTHVTGK